jgi:pseudouridine-5'-phosphate glycosidase
MGINGGMLVTNPIPKEKGIDAEVIAAHIDTALKAAARDGVSGKDVTPYLLDQMFKLTGGESLTANIALVENNARLAAKIAKAIAAAAAM